MATNVDGKKISALTEITSMSDADCFLVETASGTKRVTWANMKKNIQDQSMALTDTDINEIYSELYPS